jgi:D-glycero-D-manno-heptose 1,7-bisphosphate phosphatase
MRQAVILVGGRGTRLGELARDRPKPLMPIAGDTPFLDYLLADIARHGIEDILLLAGHLGERVRDRYDGATIRGGRISVIVEPAPAGTAGALSYVAGRLDDVFLMSNGDSLFDMNYLALAQALGPDDIGAMALRRVPDAARFGRVEFADGRVTAFHEKDASFQGAALISAGVYVLRRAVLNLVTPPPCSIEVDVFPQLVQQGKLSGRAFDGYFIDIGLPDTLGQARAEVPDQTRRGAVLFDRDGTLIVDDGYTHKLEDLRWQPGAIEAVRAANDAGYLTIVVTNQSGIARGLYDEAAMHRFHAHMQRDLAQHGAHIDAFYFSPHHPDGVVAEYAHANHPDRKPNPGMLRRALIEWPIDRDRVFVIGDTELDVGAASALGLACHKVAPGEILHAVANGFSAAPPQALDHSVAHIQDCATRARVWLFEHALPLWWERGFDRATGCFHERMSVKGEPVVMPRRIRVQARQTVVYARAGRMDWQGPWREAVEAGLDVILKKGLREDGGTRFALDAAGHPEDHRRDLYDAAFVLFALAEGAAALGGHNEAVAAADALVDWLETNWAHPEGGFLEGDITPTPPRRQNPHMHVFEALLSLYEATGEQRHLDRASTIAALFRDKFFDQKHGALPEYFNDAWGRLTSAEGAICEPGHHFEWSWLLHRWSALGGGDLGDIAERLRVHGEVYGVRLSDGVVVDELYLDGRPRTQSLRLWPQTERMKANLARFERTRDPATMAAVVQAFEALERFCSAPCQGVWRERATADGVFSPEDAPASSLYHIVFALFELDRVAKVVGPKV